MSCATVFCSALAWTVALSRGHELVLRLALDRRRSVDRQPRFRARDFHLFDAGANLPVTGRAREGIPSECSTMSLKDKGLQDTCKNASLRWTRQ